MSIKTSILLVFLFVSTFSFADENESSFNLICPPDVWLHCGAEIWDLHQYGQAHYYYNGHQYSAGHPTVQYHTTTCETGYITRTWRVEDYNWVWHECSQTIYISGGNFNYHNIYWPHDIELYGCDVNIHPDHMPYGYGRPTYDYMTCSMVGSSYKDRVFNFGGDCKKIIRTWTVLDWCNYGNGYNNPGIWTYDQIIKISNTEQPTVTSVPEVKVKADDCNYGFVNVPLVEIYGDPCYGGYEITHDSPYADYAGADASGNYPVGKTRVNFTLVYACGTEMKAYTDVIVEDKGPVPYCLATLNVVLMPVDTDNDGQIDNGMVELWAKDLDYGSYHPCNTRPLTFSFSSDVTNTSTTFTCEEAGYNDVQMWVTDHYGNQSWCLVQVIVQNNAANIPDCEEEVGNIVEGRVLDLNNEPLENVYINLKSKGYREETFIVDTTYVEVLIDSFYNATGTLLYIYDYKEEITYQPTQSFVFQGKTVDILTNDEGKFGTDDIDIQRQYSVTAFKFGDMDNIDSADLELLRQHITGEKKFESPYSYIAADINEDGILDSEDFKLLANLESGEEDEWPHERQWVFYNGLEMVDMSENPLEDHMEQKIVLVNQNFIGQDLSFVGILKGDISNYEPIASSISLPNIEKRNSAETEVYPNPFNQEIKINNLTPGVEVKINVFDTNGRSVYKTKSVNKPSLTISQASEWTPGTYIVNINSDTSTKTFRIVKLD